MSDEQNSGTPAPMSPASGGAFDWLRESHQQSAPLAPLVADAAASWLTPVAAPVPVPVAAPIPAPAEVPVLVPAPVSVPAPQATRPPAWGPGSTGFALERHNPGRRSGNRLIDWIAFVLAFLAPPIGLLLGIVAAATGSRSRGYAAGIAKAAIGIGAALSLVLAVAGVVGLKLAGDQAAHDAIARSSKAWCQKLDADPGRLASDTYGWPGAGDTIPDSITAIKAYQSYWAGLAAVAPAGIRADTATFASTAKSIEATVESTQTLNDANNVAQLQNLVQTTNIKGWDSTYCAGSGRP